MLGWALTFLILAMISALVGFGDLAPGASWIAKLGFFAFLLLCVTALIGALTRKR